VSVLQAARGPAEDELADAKLNTERNTEAKKKLMLAFEQSYPRSKHQPEVFMDFSKILVSEGDFTRAEQYAEKAVNAVLSKYSIRACMSLMRLRGSSN
jgi:hypothetical protein